MDNCELEALSFGSSRNGDRPDAYSDYVTADLIRQQIGGDCTTEVYVSVECAWRAD